MLECVSVDERHLMVRHPAIGQAKLHLEQLGSAGRPPGHCALRCDTAQHHSISAFLYTWADDETNFEKKNSQSPNPPPHTLVCRYGAATST